MLVKHLIRELQKCDPEHEVILYITGGSPYASWCVEEDPPNNSDPAVYIFSADPDPEAPEYDNKQDTTNPI